MCLINLFGGLVYFANAEFLVLFGEEKGLPARTAMGTNSCPGNIAVEIEMLVEYE